MIESAGAALRVDPVGQDRVIRGLKVEELDAEADLGLDDPDGDEALEFLAFAAEAKSRAGTCGELLAGADEAAAKRDVRSDTGDLLAGLEMDEDGIRGEGIADRVAAVANALGTGLCRRGPVRHRDHFIHAKFSMERS